MHYIGEITSMGNLEGINIKRTHEEFVSQVYDLVKDEYEVVGTYASLKKKIKMKHVTCGNIYEVTPTHFLHSGTRCPECFGHKRKTFEEFLKELYDLHGDEYTCLSTEYINLKTKVKIRHNICGCEYEVIPNNILNHNRRCPNCYGKPLKTHEKFISEVKYIHKDEYTILSQYVNSDVKVLVRHEECGNEYYVKPPKILKGQGCPECCRTSKGEAKIIEFLNENNITFKKEYTFPDLKFIHKLRFDFAIFEDDKLKLIIEYDGITHYKPYRYSKSVSLEEAEKKFKEQAIRDTLKTEYCALKKIPLFRIPYTDYLKIDEVLKPILMKI